MKKLVGSQDKFFGPVLCGKRRPRPGIMETSLDSRTDLSVRAVGARLLARGCSWTHPPGPTLLDPPSWTRPPGPTLLDPPSWTHPPGPALLDPHSWTHPPSVSRTPTPTPGLADCWRGLADTSYSLPRASPLTPRFWTQHTGADAPSCASHFMQQQQPIRPHHVPCLAITYDSY